jgi:hypothetical protein
MCRDRVRRVKKSTKYRAVCSIKNELCGNPNADREPVRWVEVVPLWLASSQTNHAAAGFSGNCESTVHVSAMDGKAN